MREIGSEFWDVPAGKMNRIFAEGTQWYLSGRSALQAIIKDLDGAKTVAMPSWCCDSMVKPFTDAGLKVDFYPVYWKDLLIQEMKWDSDVLFVMDYFGYTTTKEVKHHCIIRDVTHSIFSYGYSDADYYFGSLRKWCGVWTGGYAWTKDGHNLVMGKTDIENYVNFRKKAMDLKNCYVNGYADSKGKKVEDKAFLKYYEKAEEQLEHTGIAPAKDRDVFLADRLDVEFVKRRRRANAKLLMKAFESQLIFPELKDTDCPMFVPILVPGGRRDELRRYLIENEIYCPIHWPVSDRCRLNKRTESLYRNELSLVCDQRYTEEDMMRMIETIIRFWKVG